jgi:membrane-bound inhibitor of C-type lysozyme
MKVASAFLLVLALAACESGPSRSPVVTPQRMSCGGVPAQVILYSPEEAKLTFKEKSYTLRRMQTTSGVKYGNSDISFWNKGIDALITREDGSMTSCIYIPKTGL